MSSNEEQELTQCWSDQR